MSMYQALYENVNKELKELEKLLEELEIKRMNFKNDYDKSKKDINIKEEKLIKLKEKKDDITYKNHFKIIILIAISVLGISFCLVSANIYILVNILGKILLLFPKLVQISEPLISLLLIISFIGSAFVASKLGIMIQKKMEKISFRKISNSKEYKEILSKINELENDIKISENIALEKEKKYKNAKVEYENCKKDRNEKKLLKEYIAKQVISTETTLHKVKEYKREYCSDNSCSCF